jgi:hypothetical protein
MFVFAAFGEPHVKPGARAIPQSISQCCTYRQTLKRREQDGAWPLSVVLGRLVFVLVAFDDRHAQSEQGSGQGKAPWTEQNPAGTLAFCSHEARARAVRLSDLEASEEAWDGGRRKRDAQGVSMR